MTSDHLLYGDITEKIIGCAMKVHAYFGMGFPEVVYKRALIMELESIGLKCESEVDRGILYKEKLIGKRRLDLIVEEKVLVELKAIAEPDNRWINQLINYLRVFHIEVGLLLNFGTPSLQYKRLMNTRNQSVKS
jgi:GxxExxY protein